MLHARKKMLVMGDVQQQRQLWRIRCVRVERGAQHAVIGAVMADGRQAGLQRQILRNLHRAVIPVLSVATGNAQRQIGLTAEFIGQPRLALGRLEILQGAAQADQFRLQLLLIKFDEVRLAGAVEQHPGEQRDHRSAGGKQQRQARAQGPTTHHSERSSST